MNDCDRQSYRLTDDEMRIAIAEVCGWVWYRLPQGSESERAYRMLAHPAMHEYEGQSKDWIVRADGTERVSNMKFMAREGMIPDYPHDLNAMHSAEEFFDDKPIDMKSLYWDYLALVSMPEPFDGDDTFLRDYVMLRATARQRAEAFLRAVGKWKEPE